MVNLQTVSSATDCIGRVAKLYVLNKVLFGGRPECQSYLSLSRQHMVSLECVDVLAESGVSKNVHGCGCRCLGFQQYVVVCAQLVK